MSTEIDVSGLISPLAEGLDLAGGPDRVLHTAGDRPDADTLPALADPAADHCDQAVSRRRGDVEEKHARIAGFLDATGNEAVLLGQGRLGRLVHLGGRPGPGPGLRGELGPALPDPQQPRGPLRQRAERPRLRGGAGRARLPAQGTALARRPRPDRRRADPQPAGRHRHGVPRGPRLGRWRPAPGAPVAPDATGAAAVARAGPDPDAGRRGDLPELRPGRDRGRRRRPPGAPPDPRRGRAGRPPRRQRRPPGPLPPADASRPRRSGSGRRSPSPAGGTASAPRSPGPSRSARSTATSARSMPWPRWSTPPASISRGRRRPSPRSSAGRGGSTRNSTTRTSGRSTTRDSWSATRPARRPCVPESPFPLRSGMALSWSPSVGPARSQCTVVIDERGFEVVTAPQAWPRLDVAVKGFTIIRPGILER